MFSNFNYLFNKNSKISLLEQKEIVLNKRKVLQQKLDTILKEEEILNKKITPLRAIYDVTEKEPGFSTIFNYPNDIQKNKINKLNKKRSLDNYSKMISLYKEMDKILEQKEKIENTIKTLTVKLSKIIQRIESKEFINYKDTGKINRSKINRNTQDEISSTNPTSRRKYPY